MTTNQQVGWRQEAILVKLSWHYHCHMTIYLGISLLRPGYDCRKWMSGCTAGGSLQFLHTKHLQSDHHLSLRQSIHHWRPRLLWNQNTQQLQRVLASWLSLTIRTISQLLTHNTGIWWTPQVSAHSGPYSHITDLYSTLPLVNSTYESDISFYAACLYKVSIEQDDILQEYCVLQ